MEDRGGIDYGEREEWRTGNWGSGGGQGEGRDYGERGDGRY